MSWIITPVSTIEECRIIEQLQVDIWGSRPVEVTPDHVLLTAAKEGGVVMLARAPDGQPVGFGFGFLGRTADGRWKLASHQVGVLPAYQNSGLGYRIKLAQREAVLAMGVELITWTYDPLQGRNARFNLHKLGAVANTCYRNLYGEMRDEINRGLPSDRFRVDWWIASEHVRRRLEGDQPETWPPDCPVLNPARFEDGLPVPPDEFAPPASDACLVQVPADIDALKTANPDLALRWRFHTRQIFEQAFAQGYTAVDFLRQGDSSFYLLRRGFRIG